MRTIIRSTELGANTNVFFRVISQPVKCALTVTVHKQGRKRGKNSKKIKSVISYAVFSCREHCSEITTAKLTAGNFAPYWKGSRSYVQIALIY